MWVDMSDGGGGRIMHSTNDFDVDVAVAAASYIAQRAPGRLGMHELAKLLYFADREHLTRYGRMIVGDYYVKMDYGPVPSAVYDGIKAAARPDDEVKRSFIGPELADAFIEAFEVNNGHKSITSKAEPDMDQLSESDVECLDWALEQFQGASFGRLTEVSHGPAWTAAMKHGPLDVMEIAEENDASEEVLQHLADPHPG